jgi:hypothetical protein
MQSGIADIVAGIDAIAAAEDVGELKKLLDLMDAFFAHDEAGDHLQVWFRLFERFPLSDGYEVFWTILHGLERHEGYQELVVESVQRRPSMFSVLMVNRMINGNIRDVGGVNLMALLEAVASDRNCLEGIRKDAEGFLAYQRAKG